jgi:phosphatidylserine/phosphatidylglycerophosphate/cardiolipin synthase-like enzyme
MRKKETNGAIAVQAIAGSYVVLLGINLAESSSAGVLGFAIERIDHTEDERYWLKGFRTFEETDPNLPPGSLVSTLEHPIQAFLWGDFTAKPDHRYTYRIVALRGKPKKLEQTDTVDVTIATEDEVTGTHAVYFNRGVAGSQAYARKFKNLPPDKVPKGRAWAWLSRGLVEALLAFIKQAKGSQYELRAALYEFQYLPVLEAFGAAQKTGAAVKIIFDAKPNAQNYPRRANQEAIATAKIEALTSPRETNPSYIAHNKFIVLLKDGQPIQVWTGSTNITDGGIFGHSNVGHIVRDPAVAASYLAYWEQLSHDPTAAKLRPWNDEQTPVPTGLPPTATTTIFSPRRSLAALEWYADRMEATHTAVFLTAAFGVNDLLATVLSAEKDYLRYVLLEKEGGNIETLRRDPDTRIAVGAVKKGGTFDRFLQEKTTNLNTHVRYIHTKYMLIDPLSDDPIVITGSANFSDASTKNNDENMLVIRGDQRVADLYLGEFMRLFNHYYSRYVATLQATDADAAKAVHLKADDSWLTDDYKPGSPKQKERLYFAG